MQCHSIHFPARLPLRRGCRSGAACGTTHRPRGARYLGEHRAAPRKLLPREDAARPRNRLGALRGALSPTGRRKRCSGGRCSPSWTFSLYPGLARMPRRVVLARQGLSGFLRTYSQRLVRGQRPRAERRSPCPRSSPRGCSALSARVPVPLGRAKGGLPGSTPEPAHAANLPLFMALASSTGTSGGRAAAVRPMTDGSDRRPARH